jgi:hypothetical protein
MLLVLRRHGWAVDRVLEGAGAQVDGELVHGRHQLTPGRQRVIGPVGLDQDDVGGHLAAWERPQGGPGHRRVALEADDPPLRARAPLCDERVEVGRELGLVRRARRDLEERVAAQCRRPCPLPRAATAPSVR